MKSPLFESIPWAGGPEGLQRRLPTGCFSFCLHSSGRDRYSYLGFDPLARLKIYPQALETSVKGEKTQTLFDNPFDWLQRHLPKSSDASLPLFASGWLGFLGYEAAPFADSALPGRKLPQDRLLGFWGLYDPVYVFDHSDKKAFIFSWGLNPDGSLEPSLALERLKSGRRRWEDLAPASTPPQASLAELFRAAGSNFTRDQYLNAIEKVLRYLKAGDAYQVNLSQQFQIDSEKEIDAGSEFWRLVKRHPAPFSALIDAGELQVLSLSPEEFFTLQGDEIVTKPIKGTRRRGRDADEDAAAVQELLASPKDQAELLMIVDLERNDLGKICRPGTVQLEDFKRVETFDYVHHLVATVMGRLPEGLGPIAALRALFPGGSVTGAPKRRAMEILQELEPNPRGVYTGALGFIDASGFSRFNIPIRTLEIEGKRIRFGMGGGIVADSDPVGEWEETLAKAQVFLD